MASPGSVARTGPIKFTAVSRRRLHLIIGLFLACAGCALAAPAEIFPGLGRKWQHYQSPNFELYSAGSERDSRDVLEKMELLYAVFIQEFGLKVRLPGRVKIFYFNKEEEFRAYTPPITNPSDRFAGFSFAYPDQMILTMAPTKNRRWARELTYRQCVRFLFQLADEYPPDWFLIGLGELVATLDEDGESLILGGVIPEHVKILKEYGMDSAWQVMARDSREVTSLIAGQRKIYDAKCWAILHYCMFANEEVSPTRRASLWKTAGSELSRNRPVWFSAQIAGLLAPDTSNITEEIQRYSQNRKLSTRRILRPKIPDRHHYDQREVESAEMSEQLAELGFRAKQAAYGTFKVQEMFAQAPTLRLYELIGAVAQQEGDYVKVREYWNAAVGLGSTNTGVLNELSRIEGDNVFTQFDLDFRLPEKRAARLRELLYQSIAVAPEQCSAYEMLVWVEANVTAAIPENVAHVSGHLEKLSDPASSMLGLALVRYRQRDMSGALAMLDQVDARECTTWVAAWAEILRARIEKRPVNQLVVNRRANRN